MRGNMHQCQVLHQLAVTGHAWAEVAVLIGGQDFRIYRIERDEEKIRDLTERETQFWLQVTRNQQPEPDGSEDAGSALAWLFPVMTERPSISPIRLSSTSCSGSCCICVSTRRKWSYASRRSSSDYRPRWERLRRDCLPTARSLGNAARIGWPRSGPARSGSSRPTQPLRQTGARLTPFHYSGYSYWQELNSMIKGLAITPPVIGRICIGRLVQKDGKWVPEKDDSFTLTTQVQQKGMVAPSLASAVRSRA